MAPSAVQRVGKSATTASLAIGAGDGWAAPTAGNTLVVSVCSDFTVTAPSGSGTWTAGPSIVANSAVYTYYKIATGTETTITLAPSGSAKISVTACEYAGLLNPSFDDSNSSMINNSLGTVTTAATVNTTAAGDLILGFALLHGTGGGSIASPTSPSWTNSHVNQLSTSTGGTTDADTTIFLGELLAAGAAGAYSTVASWTNQRGDREHVILAFKAAAGSALTRTVDDPAGLTDAAAAISSFVRTVNDSAGLVDTTAAASAFARAQTDAAGHTDAAAAAAAFARTATDDAGLTDAVSALTSSGLTRTVDDAAGLTDTRALAQAATATDSAGLTDTMALARTATVTDLAGLTDSTSVQLAAAGTRQVDDALGLTDTIGVASTQTLADTLGLVDAVTLAMVAARAATDALGITDTASAAVAYAVTIADATGLADSTSAALTTGGSQTVTVTDSIGLDSTIRLIQTTHRPAGGTTSRPFAGITPRYPLVPD